MKHDPGRRTLRDGWQIWPKPAAEGEDLRWPPVGDVADCMEALGENISLKTSARQDCYFAPLFAASAMTALPSTR